MAIPRDFPCTVALEGIMHLIFLKISLAVKYIFCDVYIICVCACSSYHWQFRVSLYFFILIVRISEKELNSGWTGDVEASLDEKQ